jgi:Xaa-Pro aminopeptidase
MASDEARAEARAGLDARLEAELKARGLDALIVTRDANQRFLEGYTGSDCYLLASGQASWLVADSRYTEQAERECRRARVAPHRDPHPPYAEVLARLASSAGFGRVGFEAACLSYAQYAALMAAFEGGPELVPTESVVEKLRMVKEGGALELIERACAIADRALEAVLSEIREGVSELDVDRELEYRIRQLGGERSGFETIVAFGARSSQPHAVPSAEAKLAEGDLVLIDYGVLLGGYRSDTTRTFVLGRSSARQREVYGLVLESQRRGIEAMVAGASGAEPDAVARGYLAERCAEGVFSYGLGHGVGLEIHEEPFMSRRCEIILEGGMVVTCEPGLYLPGWGGVRIEDSVLIGEGGPRCLTSFPKESLIEL